MKTPWLAAIAIILANQCAVSAPVKRTTLQNLCSISSIVVKGRVLSVQDDSTTRVAWPVHGSDIKTKCARMVVSDVLKGSVPSSPIRVLFAEGPEDLALQRLKVDGVYLLFLSAEGDAARLADPQNAAIACAAGPPFTPAPDIQSALRREFERTLSLGETEFGLTALHFLSEVGDRNSLPKIALFFSSTNDAIRVTAFATAVSLGDWEKVEPLVRFLDEHSMESGAFIFPQGVNIDALALLESLRTISSPDASPRLIGLVRSARNPFVRTQLIESPCIRSDPGSIPALFLLLDDESTDVAYAAYRALASRAKSPIAAKNIFQSQKTKLADQLRSNLGMNSRASESETDGTLR